MVAHHTCGMSIGKFVRLQHYCDVIGRLCCPNWFHGVYSHGYFYFGSEFGFVEDGLYQRVGRDGFGFALEVQNQAVA